MKKNQFYNYATHIFREYHKYTQNFFFKQESFRLKKYLSFSIIVWNNRSITFLNLGTIIVIYSTAVIDLKIYLLLTWTKYIIMLTVVTKVYNDHNYRIQSGFDCVGWRYSDLDYRQKECPRINVNLRCQKEGLQPSV